MPAVVLVNDKLTFFEIDGVEGADVLALLAEGAVLGIPLETHFAMTVHRSPSFFPAFFPMA
jgi:hypothetical protein